MGIPLLDCGNHMRVEVGGFHGRKNADLVSFCHFRKHLGAKPFHIDNLLSKVPAALILKRFQVSGFGCQALKFQ